MGTYVNINLQQHACICDHLLGKIDFDNIHFEIELNIYSFDHLSLKFAYYAVDYLLVVACKYIGRCICIYRLPSALQVCFVEYVYEPSGGLSNLANHILEASALILNLG